MSKILKNYRSSLILLGSIILGTIVGLIFKEKADVLSPFGDLFINMLLISIIPLIFLTITTSIGKMKTPKRVGKILRSIVIVFIFTSLVSVFIGIGASRIKLVNSSDTNKIVESLDLSERAVNEDVNFLKRTVNTISTNDFANLFSKEYIIPLIVFSILIGIAINRSKEKGEAALKVLTSLNDVLNEFIKLLMYYAPIGLGCYFAAFVGNFGSSIAIGYAKTLVIYTITCLFVYFIVYSIYAFIAGGLTGFVKYWKNIIPATVTALSTCSSAASIPVNTMCAKNIGVSDDIADTTIPLGTSFHKDGSIIGSVFKIMFLVYLFNVSVNFPKVLGVALLATILVTAVPIGGGTISEMLILTMMDFSVGALPILTIIATIIDAPATVLNVVGDSASSMLVERIVDGNVWEN